MLSDLGRSLVRILGLTMVLLGLGFASHYFFRFDVSTMTEGNPYAAPSRVVNIGKTAERQAGITYWAYVSLLGVAAMYAGKEPEKAPSPAPTD